MTTAALPAPAWTDAKRYLWLLGILVMTLPVGGYFLYQNTGWSIFWWYAPLFVYGVIPFLDWAIGEDRSNPPESAVPSLVQDRYYRWAVYAALPVQYATFVWGAWMSVTGGLAWHEWLGLAVSVGGVTGTSINTAHELGHKTDPVERWLAKIALAPVAYGHFYVEHNRGHHVRVATPEDPASARYGETFWQFLPRTVFGSLASAWRIEKARLARAGHGPWHWRNDNLQAWSLTVLLYGALSFALGWKVLPFLAIQAVYGFSLLESVNYLEHYGLARQKLPDGRYERCEPRHSWNSNHTVTNLFLYHLQRHSDHHANPTRSYQALRHFDDSPQLPSGYASMVLLSYFPPLWFRVMDPRVVAHYGGDLRRANVQPSLRDKLSGRLTPGQP
ncbi:MAG TPA: alkane 1-monooxygenase [Candidatus Binatia bacterium]|nr:alkane 1-monooxygenase [Candidatus Binatia bacterium]